MGVINMRIDDLITRFDEGTLQEILGKEVIGTLNALGTQYVYSESLLEVLKNTFSNGELLLNKTSRNHLIDVLNLQESKDLSNYLSLTETRDCYQLLKEQNFKGEYLKKLFLFFEEEQSKEESVELVFERNIPTQYPLYPYQKNILKAAQKILNSEKNRVLLHMPTGSGKTRTAISYICKFFFENEDKNVIWFANTKELLDQAHSEFIKAWTSLGDREIKVYKFWDKSKIKLSEIKGSFIVAGLDKTYQALMKDVGSMSIFSNNCSLIIMDEAHMAIAPTYKLLLQNMIVNNASLIGLSATPGRTWNDPSEDQKLADFFYRQKAMLKIEGYENPVDYLTTEGYLAKVKNTKLLSDSGIRLTQNDYDYLSKHYVLPEHVLKAISEDRIRNMTIVTKVKDLIKRHQRIILFAITKDHAIVLNSLLTALGLTSSVVTSDTNSFDRAKIIEKFKVSRKDNPTSMVLCNYGILTTGFDAPETSCAVIARPTDSLVLYSQMVGRAIRGVRSGGNIEAEIVTVIDAKLPGFNEVADAFINWEDVWTN
jgi:DNA repair protein RadD